MSWWMDKYDFVCAPLEGIRVVRLKTKYGHVDSKGKVITPVIYHYAWGFVEGRAAVELNNKYGHVNRNGKVTTLLMYTGIGNFKNKKARVELNRRGFGYVNKNGVVVEGHRSLIKGVFE